MAKLSYQLLTEFSATASQSSDRWVRKKGLYRLWFEYLAISPSYEVARRYRAGKPIAQGDMPADFERVLAVYDDLGDVQRVWFDDWWKEVGLRHFGFQGKPPRVTTVGYLPHRREGLPDLESQLAKYLTQDWLDQGRQRVLMVAIPVGLPESKIAQQIKKQLARVKPEKRSLIVPTVEYSLVGKRHHHNAMLRYLRMASFYGVMHSHSIWRVAVRAKISEAYSSVLDPDATEVTKDSIYDREMLTIMGSRAVLRARMISENAARGIFPAHEKCENALEFDRKSLGKLIVSRYRWRRKMLQKQELSND